MMANTSFVPHVRFVHDITAIAYKSQELTKILQKIVQNAGALLNVSDCSLALVDASGATLITLAALLPQGQQPCHTRFRFNEGVAGWVAEHRQSLLLNQAERDPRFKHLGRQPVGSMLCVPLLDQQQLLGTLTVSSEQSDLFDGRMQYMLEILADQAVQTIGQARLTAIAQQQTNQLEMLFRLSRGITARLDPETLYHTMLTYTQRVAPCERAVIYLAQEGRQELIPVAELSGELMPAENAHYIHNIRTDHLHSERISLSNEESLPVWAVQHRHPMLRAPLAQSSEQAELAVPFIAKNVLYGVLWLRRAEPFRNDEFRQVRHLSTIAAVALENMALFQEARSGQNREITRMKANFLSMVAHELRSPINTINGYLDLTLEGIAGELTEQQHEFVQRARAGSEHLYALVEDLLLISRADAGQLHLNRALIHLPEVIENAVEEMELTASDNGIAIEVEVAPELPRLYADAIRLQQVLRNLLSNAQRFTSKGGRVTVSARLAEQAVTSPDEEGRVVELIVRDTGVGIAPENQQRIFERFFQIAEGGRGRASGQGLGLAIVKMIVELHGGSVMVESAPEEGSSFVCTLPCLLT
jgi:signal transduction histidine kinase